MALLSRLIPTPLGDMLALASATGLCLLEFASGTARLDKERAQVQAARGPANDPATDLAINNPSATLDQLQIELAGYFVGQRRHFDVPLDLVGTPFQLCVWRALLAIAYGTTWSYAREAQYIGHPTATRAVAAANGQNKIAIVVPCHRVIGSNGTLTGYGGGLPRKHWLIEWESGADPLWPQENPGRETLLRSSAAPSRKTTPVFAANIAPRTVHDGHRGVKESQASHMTRVIFQKRRGVFQKGKRISR